MKANVEETHDRMVIFDTPISIIQKDTGNVLQVFFSTRFDKAIFLSGTDSPTKSYI
jgi:folate-dependent tRNA-U54 methylase TrmFO/GidA